MQTEVASDNTQNGSELEARKRSAMKWRKRIIWLPIILSILMVPGCIADLIFYPQDFQMTNWEETVNFAVFWALGSLIFMMPPMLVLAWLVGRPFIYTATKLFFAVIGVAIGLSIVTGWYWLLVGDFVAQVTLATATPDPVAAPAYEFAAIISIIIMPALAIAAVVGGVSGLIYGWFRGGNDLSRVERRSKTSAITLPYALFGTLLLVLLAMVVFFLVNKQDTDNGGGAPEDYVEMAQLYRKYADQGDASAQFNLAIMYYNGEGVPQDYAEAVRWYRKAADQDYASAQYNLGLMYNNGVGVPEDDAEAARLFRLAADQGHAGAQFGLGSKYDTGEGVPQNYAEAARWYRLAADQGNAFAQYNLAKMYRTGEGVPEDNAEAVRWYRLAAEQGYADAQFGLGYMYDDGLGVPEDDAEAVRWYRKAADQGHATAQYNLGWMYRNGEGVPQDYAEAVRLYRLAAEQGDADAQLNLGYMYYNGEGVPQNYVASYMWYEIASANGEYQARQWLEVTKKMTPEQVAEAKHRAKVCMESNYKDCD